MKIGEITKNLRYDIPAGVVVFLVALPLCLGIALASGAPLVSGVITGIVGGVVVSLLSGSQLAVSGPAAGLTIIVLNGIDTLGSFELFVLAVFISGIIQFIFGVLRAGIIAYYFPSAVIKGMLAAIGLILILKQIPHFLGVDRDTFGDVEFFQADGLNTFTEILYSIGHISYGSFIVGVLSLAILLLWERPFIKKNPVLSFIPGALLAVFLGVLVNLSFYSVFPALAITPEHMVSIPIFKNYTEMTSSLAFPDFSGLNNSQVYVVAMTLAIVASLETLLCLEATDKLDPQKRISPVNKELLAQGVGNALSGLIGGLPMTAVIVRSSANIDSGAKTRISAFIHGLLLLAAVLVLPHIMNLIPLSCLASILLVVGFKLTKPSYFVREYKLGFDQFVPFVVTILAILFTDLLIGIGIGMFVGIYFILKVNYKNPYCYHVDDSDDFSTIKISLSENVTFLNKASVAQTLNTLPENSKVEINGENSVYISHDVLEIIHDFKISASEKKIELNLKGIPEMV
jgi:MFS superfamily sulfate permease-like transporter